MPNKRTEQPWERQKGESPQAFAAFLIYLELGPKRSLHMVGQQLGKSRGLMERWSSANHWVERCRAWDNHLQQEARRAAVAEVRQMNKRHANMAQQMQKAAMKALKEMGSNMVNPKNIAAIVKLATELERQSLEAQAADLGRDDAGSLEQEDDPITQSLKEAQMNGSI